MLLFTGTKIFYANYNHSIEAFFPEHRRVIGKLTRADGVIKEEIILRERSLPRSLCYDPRRRNLYVAELFGGPRERSERSVGGSRNWGDQDTTIPTEILWSSIMVGVWSLHWPVGWCKWALLGT